MHKQDKTEYMYLKSPAPWYLKDFPLYYKYKMVLKYPWR